MKLTEGGLPDLPEIRIDDGWRFGVPVEAAWNDIDKLGHVTNAAYWRWCDDARVQYIMAAGLPEPGLGQPSFVLMSADGVFLAPMQYRDKGIMTCRTVELGRTSTTTEHALWLTSGRAFTARFKLVLLDKPEGRPMTIPDTVRNAITELEGVTGSR